MLTHKIKNEEGSGLILTLMVLLVLSVLGASVATVTMGSNRLGHATQDSNSAYYIAEAGANMAYEEIRQGVVNAYDNNNELGVQTTIDSLPDEYNNFDMQSGHQPEAHVSVSEPETEGNKKTYTITSTGKIGLSSRTVTKEFVVTWKDKSIAGGGNIPTIPPESALIAKNKLNILNGTIKGNAYISSIQKKSVKLSGGQGGNDYSVIYPMEVTFEDILDANDIYEPTPLFVQKDININWEAYDKLLEIGDQFIMPMQTKKLKSYEYVNSESNKYWLVDQNGSIKLNNWMIYEYTIELTSNLHIPTIDIDSKHKLILDTGNKDHIIYVDNLSVMSGALDIIGTGSVTIVVRNSLSFNQQSFINQSGSVNQLLLAYTGNSPNFSEITSVNGHIISIGNSSNIKIKNSTINGVFLTDAKKIEFTGGNTPSNMMMIAPKSEINLGSGYNIRGTLIGDNVTTTGGGTIYYEDIDTSNFPYGSGTNQGKKPDIDDLISTDPAIEK